MFNTINTSFIKHKHVTHGNKMDTLTNISLRLQHNVPCKRQQEIKHMAKIVMIMINTVPNEPEWFAIETMCGMVMVECMEKEAACTQYIHIKSQYWRQMLTMSDVTCTLSTHTHTKWRMRLSHLGQAYFRSDSTAGISNA